MKCKRCGGTGELPDFEDLRKEREAAGVNQFTLALKIGIAPSYLCDLELGRREWNLALVNRFRAALSKLKTTLKTKTT